LLWVQTGTTQQDKEHQCKYLKRFHRKIKLFAYARALKKRTAKKEEIFGGKTNTINDL
jgi:hypothetical protein